MRSAAASINDEEVARFSAQAADWWDLNGPFKPLHRLNPLRIQYLRDQICGHYGREAGGRKVLQGLSLLDVGCGGGILTEPLARLGATVTGLDASPPAIDEARRHATVGGLAIDYRCGSVEALAAGKARFDVVTALEIVEHVADLDAFIAALAALVKPGGLLILSTLNRTPQSFALGIVAAEYLLGWVPRGTHDWRKFVRPSELAARLTANDLVMADLTGMVFNPLRNEFQLKPGAVAVNYILTARKN